MCIKSCIGFTGSYVDLDQCLCCGEGRYKEKELRESGGMVKIPKQVFTTIPVGPQLQARWKHPLSGFDGLGLLNGQFLSSTGSLVFGKQADLCQVRCALDNKFLRVNRFTILPEDNLMSS